MIIEDGDDVHAGIAFVHEYLDSQAFAMSTRNDIMLICNVQC